MDPSILIFLALMLGMMWFISSRGKKQQAAARQKLEEALVPGTWVMTIGGFLGKIVDIDGDVITLESPSGVETIWNRTAIREAKEPPYASADEDEVEADGVVVVPDDAGALGGTPTAVDGTGTTGTGGLPPVDRGPDGDRENPRP